MRKLTILCTVVITLATLTGCGQETKPEDSKPTNWNAWVGAFDALFYPFDYTQFPVDIKLLRDTLGPRLTNQLLDSNTLAWLDPQLPTGIYYTVGKTVCDKQGKRIAYLIGYNAAYSQSIIVYVFSKNTDRFVFHTELSKDAYLEGAFEEHQSALIVDVNSDGYLDFLISQYLIDFEYDAEGSPNTTGGEDYGFLLTNDTYLYTRWTEAMEAAWKKFEER